MPYVQRPYGVVLMLSGFERRHVRDIVDPDATRADARNAVIAGFLGWTLDAFDFFVLTFVPRSIAKDFGTDVSRIVFTLTATLSTRWIGAIIFGLLADRFGRRLPLIINVLYYALIEVLSGLAPTYAVFLTLRLLYGIGMGGEWGVGASLTMESIPVRWRGILSGFLQEGYAFGALLAAGASSSSIRISMPTGAGECCSSWAAPLPF